VGGEVVSRAQDAEVALLFEEAVVRELGVGGGVGDAGGGVV
jgi:hypothetical protein